MSCANDVCINAAGTSVAENLAKYKDEYAYMVRYREIPPEVTTSLTYEKYLAYVSAMLLSLQAKTKGVICESTGVCECNKPKFFYAQYIGATDGAYVPAITVCIQKLN